MTPCITLSGTYNTELERLRLRSALEHLASLIPDFPTTAYVLTHEHSKTRTIVVPDVPWAPSGLDAHSKEFAVFHNDVRWRTGAQDVQEITIVS